MSYVDGYVLPIPKKHLKAYTALARKAAKVWMDHGAISYRECALEDARVKCGFAFPKVAKAKAGDTVIFAYIEFRSRASRDAVNKKVFNDPRIAKMMKNAKMPLDMDRMVYGGFKAIVRAGS